VAQDSVVGKALRGSNPGGGGARFSAPVQSGPAVPSSLLYIGYRASFTGGNAAGAWH